jgi:OOP family OmpA-OmpF porin
MEKTMKRVIFGGVMVALCAAGASRHAVAADAYDDTGAWYLSLLGQYTLLDDKRVSKDDFGFQVGLGYDIAPQLAGEVALSSGAFHVKGSGASEKLSATSFDLLFKVLPATAMFRPYVLVGAGGMTDNIGRFSGDNNAWLAEGGVGLLTGLGSQSSSTRLQLRTEAKYRYEFIRNTPLIPNDPRDVIFGVGLQLMFGAPTPPPPPVAKALPPPPPEPPPPPPPPPPPVDGDDDGDGVPNSIDRCPNTPKGDKVDAYGCTIKDEIRLPGVTFATNSAELTPESDMVLGYAVTTLKHHPEFVIEVDGHTDSVGTDKYNLALSQRRAQSVLDYIKGHGVTNTLTAKGYGKADPIDDNRTAEGRLANRRVALKVVSGL